jgi:Flp pilus assembly protein TadG
MRKVLAWAGRLRARYTAACGGNVALIFGLTFPVLVGIAGLGIDSAAITNQRTRMQSAADSTALAVGKEMNLSVEDLAPLKQSGTERAEVLLAELGIADRPHNVDITFDQAKASTHVQITMETRTFLPAEVWGENPIVVDAVANTLGTKLCVLSLQEVSKDVLALDGLARVNAPDCAVQSNSKDPEGLSAKTLSLLTSAYTCSSGGYEGDLSLFVPPPDTDCPKIDDPLELRQPPTVGGCDFDGVTIDISQTIAPGHYCGGLKIKNGAQVTAEAGIYIISGGSLEVKNSASLKGDGVGFYFADDDATFDFKNHSVVELSGPTSGPLAGLLFYQNPAVTHGRDFKISSDKVRKLIGTIYLPRGTFEANAKLDETVTSLLDPLRVIGEASTYTIIVANKIELDGVNLVINADYASSDVPVPSGLGPKASKVRLVK